MNLKIGITKETCLIWTKMDLVLLYIHLKRKKCILLFVANKINDDERSDRVIATKWDAAFTLYDGEPDKNDIERLKMNLNKNWKIIL